MWEETFFFCLPPRKLDAMLQVEVFDWNRLISSTEIGTVAIYLDELTPNQVEDRWYILCSTPKEHEVPKQIGKSMAKKGFR